MKKEIARDLTKVTKDKEMTILIKKIAKYSFLFSKGRNFTFFVKPCKKLEKTKPKLKPMNQEMPSLRKVKINSNKLKDIISKKVIKDRVKRMINSKDMNCLFVCINRNIERG